MSEREAVGRGRVQDGNDAQQRARCVESSESVQHVRTRAVWRGGRVRADVDTSRFLSDHTTLRGAPRARAGHTAIVVSEQEELAKSAVPQTQPNQIYTW